ncbi:hypothetical protein LOZ65_004625 [Ophidiomyces ophidiicola]|nr:hypothetical protein LOZ65_004625 [Ophidiomyces ophidiicola]
MGPVKRKAPAQRSRTHWMDMVNRERAPPKPDLKESSKQTMELAQELDPPGPRHWLENLNLNVVETFLRWYLETHNVVSLNGFLVRVQYWRMYYCYETNHDFPYTLNRETKNLICGTLKEEYDLQETMRFLPPINADDLLSNLYFDLAISDVMRHRDLRWRSSTTLFDRAVQGNIVQLQNFMNEFILKILSETDYNTELAWAIPMQEDVAEHARYFIILRDAKPISYGAKALVPLKRDGGYISVSAKEDQALEVEFAIVYRAKQGDPRVDPVLDGPGMSTIELKEEDSEIVRVEKEKSFRAFLFEAIQDLPVPE